MSNVTSPVSENTFLWGTFVLSALVTAMSIVGIVVTSWAMAIFALTFGMITVLVGREIWWRR